MRDEIYDLIVYLALRTDVAMQSAGMATDSIPPTESIIEALSQLESEKDYYTLGHSQNVARIALKIAKKRGIKDKNELDMIEKASLLHDVGKITVSEKILNKTQPLTKKEFKQIRKHPRVGANIISRIKTLEKAAYYVLSHHERWDGKGYPEGLSGEGIPLASRIIGIADSIEAMLSDRPYRRGLSKSEIREELIKEAGKQFDPSLVKITVELIDSGEI